MHRLLSSFLFSSYHESNPAQESLEVLPSYDAKVVGVFSQNNGLLAILPSGAPSLIEIGPRMNVEVGSKQFIHHGQQLDP